MQRRFTVEPRQPTALQTESAVKLPGYELWMNYIENVLIIPTRLDLNQFKDALSETLRHYPHAAGDLCRGEVEWEIRLSNRGIPIEVEEVGTTFIGIGDRWVLQQDIRPFLPQRGPGIALTSHSGPEAATPSLLLFKITLSERETAVGVSWHHTLGDATVLERFMRYLSESYQGNDRGQTSAPTFTKRQFPAPTGSLIERYAPLMPHLIETYSAAEVGKRYAQMNANTSWVKFKVSFTQIRILKGRVLEKIGQTDIAPSLQDVLTAYIVGVLNRCLDVPITSITNAASYRDIPGAVLSHAVAGNAIYIIPTAIAAAIRPPLTETAMTIRQSILRCREPAFVEEYMTAANALMLEAVNKDRSWSFAAPPGKLSVNSNLAVNWRSAHFGYPQGTRFHTSGLSDRYVRVFLSNPEADGGSVAGEDQSAQTLDVFFAVANAVKGKIMDIIATELEAATFPFNVAV
ncbi:hypothetical protein BD414DRAFT_476401 [Trametes punicea]|nr:hypothetical protein BD414DRAFT_476401 [Trametes punicea]